MKRRSWLTINIEYVALKTGLLLIPLFPRWMIVAFANLLGDLFFLGSKKLRKIGLENMAFVFGDEKTAREKKQILRQALRHQALMSFDLFWFMRNSKKRTMKYLDIASPVEWIPVGRAQIMLTAHYGNWEFIGQALNALNIPLMSIAAPLNNPKVNRMFIQMREKTGQTIIPQQGAIRKLLRGLKENGKIAILLDQNTLPKDGGVFVDFFGLPVPVSSAPAAIVARANCEIVVGFCLPRTRGRYKGFISEVLKPPFLKSDGSPMNVQEITQLMTSAIQRQIRKEPECWLWTYKRWKYIAPGYTQEDFLSYSRTFKEEEESILNVS